MDQNEEHEDCEDNELGAAMFSLRKQLSHFGFDLNDYDDTATAAFLSFDDGDDTGNDKHADAHFSHYAGDSSDTLHRNQSSNSENDGNQVTEDGYAYVSDVADSILLKMR